MQRNRQAFTLAEMMVVMLILTVILAAFAPMMTKRKTVDLGTPWRWAANNRDIYFGLAQNQSVMIGRNAKPDDDNAKLIIQTKGDQLQSHILFKDQAGNNRGRIILNNGNFLFGNDFVAANSFASSTAFGNGALSNNTGDGNTAIGTNALNSNSSGIENTVVGHGASQNDNASFNVAIGYEALKNGDLSAAPGAFVTSNNHNIAIGYQALGGQKTDDESITSSENIALGTEAMRNSPSGAGNIAIGRDTLKVNTNYWNIAIGGKALMENTTGTSNIAIGAEALTSAKGNNNNTAIGHNAMMSINAVSTANDNTAVGHEAMKAQFIPDNGVSTAGHQASNTAIGAYSLKSLYHGGYNVAVGASALASNTDGNRNTAVGTKALYSNTTSGANTAVGDNALYKNTTGGYNVAIGGPTNPAATLQTSSALYANTTGSKNVAIGNGALKTNTTGSDNVAIGYMALDGISGLSNNVAVGSNAMITSSHAKNSTAIGYSALKGTKLSGSVIANSQEENTAIGANALSSVTSGAYNTAVGSSTLASNNSGRSNVAFGHKALYSNTTGIGNIAIGGGYNVGTQTTLYGPLHKNTTGFGNIAIGLQALLENTTGRDNIAIGYQALLNNKTDGVIPSNNIAIGKQALKLNTTGSNNLAIGNNACAEIGIGTGITCIGNNSGPKGYSSMGLANPSFHIGTEDVPVYIARRVSSDSTDGKGGNVYIGGNDSVVHVGSGTTSKINIGNRNGKHYIYVAGDPPASSGIGGTISIGGSGAKVVIAGRIVACNGNFDFAGVSCSNTTPVTPPQDPAVTYTTETQLAYTLSDMRKKNIKSEYKSGLEQIRQMMPKNFVYKDDEHKINRVGLIAQDLEKIMPEAVKKDKDGFSRVSNEHIKYALVNAVKQLDTLVQNIVTQVKELADKILCIDKRVKELEKENKELKQQIDKINKRLEKLENDD